MPTTTPEHDERIAKMTFSSVYPHYVTKVEKKGRTTEELHQVINWLTGFDDKQLQKCIDDRVTFEEFFQHATLNPNVHLITGVICGYQVAEIENPLTRQGGTSTSSWTNSPRERRCRTFSAPGRDLRLEAVANEVDALSTTA